MVFLLLSFTLEHLVYCTLHVQSWLMFGLSRATRVPIRFVPGANRSSISGGFRVDDPHAPPHIALLVAGLQLVYPLTLLGLFASTILVLRYGYAQVGQAFVAWLEARSCSGACTPAEIALGILGVLVLGGIVLGYRVRVRSWFKAIAQHHDIHLPDHRRAGPAGWLIADPPRWWQALLLSLLDMGGTLLLYMGGIVAAFGVMIYFYD